jgi:bacteriocin biosynthesis cyclodehydratase domain-containing protein
VPLRIDPRLPLVWRSPQSLQLGVDRPAVVLETVSNAEERMLAALIGGTTRTGLGLVADAAGASMDDVDALLDRVGPALVPAPRPHQLGSVVVSGVGAAADRIRYALEERGLLQREVVAGSRPDLAVLVAHFVVDPADRARWLSLDVPHATVLLGDSEARIGPIVEPGITPCLHCLELERRDADAAWPAIASQLWGRAASVDTPLFAGELTSHVVRLVEARLSSGRSEVAESLTIDGATGSHTTRGWAFHPECGCAVQPGSDSAGARHPAAAPGPTTGSTAPALA